MKKNSIAIALAVCAAMVLSASAPAQKKVTKPSNAETSLVGIKLMDSGTKVVSVYGSPDQIEAVSMNGGVAGPGGGAAGGAGGRGLPGGGGPPGGGGGGGGSTMQAKPMGPMSPTGFDFGNEFLQGPMGPRTPRSAGASGGGGGPAGGPGMGGGPGGGDMGATQDVVFTRWIYNRRGAKYAFVFDKYNRVVQIEAIGLLAGKARTRRGVTFGTSFASIVKKYGAPDGYEIQSDNSLIVRYLNKAKCAFRLSRLGQDKPHVVTGIVVAAGKR